MKEDVHHIGLDLLDRQLVDVNGVNCGKVDDLVLLGRPDDRPAIEAIVIGPGTWPDRLHGLTRLLVKVWLRLLPHHGDPVVIPWSEVIDVQASVQLARPRSHYGLDRSDRVLDSRVLGRHPQPR